MATERFDENQDHDPAPRPGPVVRPPLAELAPVSGFLLVFWIILSGSLQPADLALGAALALLLGWWATAVLWTGDAPTLTPRQLLRLVPYLAGLILAVLRSAAHAAGLILHPSLPVHPEVVRHRTWLTRRVSRVALANSLTLTPGTLSVDLDGDTLIVHTLAPGFAALLTDGTLEARVARVFEPGEAR